MLPINYLYDASYELELIEPPEDAWKATVDTTSIETTNGYKYQYFGGGRCNGKTMEVAKMYLEKSNLPKIKKVIFNYPATIIIWEDKSKTVVKLMDGDTWDPEKGFAMAYLKKLLGTQRLRKEIKTYVKPQEKLESAKIAVESYDPDDYLSSIKKALKNIFNIDTDGNSAEEENK